MANLPFGLQGIIRSGTQGNIYAGTKQKYTFRVGKKVKDDYQNKNTDFVVKIMYNSKYNIRDINRTINAQQLVRGQICPHFALAYGQFHLKSAPFVGIKGYGVKKFAKPTEKVKNTLITEGAAVGVIMENLGDITMHDYLYWKPEKDELKQILFQCYIGIYALVKILKMNHGDFQFNNIMLLQLSKPKVFRYKINEQLYVVKAKKFYPVIIDINGNLFGEKVSDMRDIRYLNKQINKHKRDLFQSLNLIYRSRLNSFFKYNFDEYKVNERYENRNILYSNKPTYIFP
tara:strand:+ start:2368 stop:3228 length:861 start_codon:yes stop_codon:yes gene_type:complete